MCKLKSLARIDNMIKNGRIKKIYVSNWHNLLLHKIKELFGDKVEVCNLPNLKSFIDAIEFKQSDCLLLDEMIWSHYGLLANTIEKARESGAFIKLLSEDVFNVVGYKFNPNAIKELVFEMNNFKIVSKNEYALARLKDGCNKIQIQAAWVNISKGHNFVFKLGDMYYSVDYLDRVLEI